MVLDRPYVYTDGFGYFSIRKPFVTAQGEYPLTLFRHTADGFEYEHLKLVSGDLLVDIGLVFVLTQKLTGSIAAPYRIARELVHDSIARHPVKIRRKRIHLRDDFTPQPYLHEDVVRYVLGRLTVLHKGLDKGIASAGKLIVKRGKRIPAASSGASRRLISCSRVIVL